MVKFKAGRYYVRFRHRGQDIMVVTDARNLLEAKRIATNIKFLVKTGQWESLDEESLKIAVRLYENRGWRIPPEIFAQFRDVIEHEITLQDAARLCYQDPFVRTQSVLYKERLKQCFKKLYKFRGPSVLISAIDVQFIKEYMEYRIGEGAAMDTVKREKTALGRIFQTLIENRLCEHNPVRDVKWRQNRKAAKKRRPFLCLPDFWKLYEHLPEHCKALVHLAYMTGMRQGEVRCLALQQLDLPRFRQSLFACRWCLRIVVRGEGGLQGDASSSGGNRSFLYLKPVFWGISGKGIAAVAIEPFLGEGGVSATDRSAGVRGGS